MAKRITKAELSIILELHLKWRMGEGDGRRADLRGADLQDANLWGADLRGADLWGADLQGADLRGADLDYSCLPLWCGGSKFKASSKLVLQLCAHISTLIIDDADDELKSALEVIRKTGEKSHRACALGLLEG